jgi:nucleoside-diphosphate-sugar epimerase
MFEKNSGNSIFNIASNPEEEVTITELGYKIWDLMKPDEAERDIKFIPYASFGKYEDVMRRVPNISKIKSELGYEPTYTLETGLKKTIEWQKKLFEKSVLITP